MITTVLEAPNLDEYYFFCYTITKHREASSLYERRVALEYYEEAML
jgi:hypothetical protein